MATMAEKMAAVEAAAAKATGAAQPENDADLITGHLDADQLNDMTVKELKKLADDMGLEYDAKIKKDDLVALIAAEPVQVEKAAIVDGGVDPDAAPEATDGLIIGVDLAAAPEADAQDDPEDTDEDPTCVDVELEGRVLVTYTGMVNLRDDKLNVVGQAMQGQTFPVVGACTRDGATWYRIEDQADKQYLISGDVVRYMA